jgi:hypothetical protein
MTTNTNKSLSDIFDIELTTTDKTVGELAIAAKAESIDSLETQRKYVKNNIVALLEKGTALLDNMSDIAKSTEASKDFQVAAAIIDTLVKANMTLLDCEVVHKPKIEQNKSETGETITNNTAVFVGSTSDLSKYLKDSIQSNIPKFNLD